MSHLLIDRGFRPSWQLYTMSSTGFETMMNKAWYVDYVVWRAVADPLDRFVTDWSHADRGIVQNQLALINKSAFWK